MLNAIQTRLADSQLAFIPVTYWDNLARPRLPE